MLFKRKVLIGNLLIAGLTGLVPLLAMVYFKVSNWHYLAFSEFDPTTWTAEIDYGMIYFLAAFAFIQNLAREIIKDMQDIKGDELIYVKSLPMVIGEWKSLQFVCALLLLLPLFLIILLIAQIKTILNMDHDHFLLSSVPFLITTSLNVLVVILIYKKRSEKLKLYDILIKLSMLIGVLSSFYLASI
jgi:4-hydroxybenzoate polyprenyltransferase